jgi:hypothetical protein
LKIGRQGIRDGLNPLRGFPQTGAPLRQNGGDWTVVFFRFEIVEAGVDFRA